MSGADAGGKSALHAGAASGSLARRVLGAFVVLDVVLGSVVVLSYVDLNAPGVISSTAIGWAVGLCGPASLAGAALLCWPIARFEAALKTESGRSRAEVERAGPSLYRFPSLMATSWSVQWCLMILVMASIAGVATSVTTLLLMGALLLGPFVLAHALCSWFVAPLVRVQSLLAREMGIQVTAPPMSLRTRLAVHSLVLSIAPPLYIVAATFAAREKTIEFSHLVSAVSVTGVGVAIYALICAALLASSIARPLGEMADIMRDISRRGDVFDVGRVPLYKADEIGALAVMVNQTLDRLAASDQERRRAADSLVNLNQTLERRVEERTAELSGRNHEMRLVLDNVDQGLFTIDQSGAMSSEYSATIELWFGPPPPGEMFYRFFSRHFPAFGEETEVAWQQVVEDFLPPELTLSQMPQHATGRGKYFRFTYALIGGEPRRFLVVVSDITQAIERDALDRERKETFELFERMLADRASFITFMQESSEFVGKIAHADVTDHSELRRALHTLKGNAACFGLESVAGLCHELESQLDDEEHSHKKTLDSLVERWSKVSAQVERLLGERRRVIELSPEQHLYLQSEILRGAPRDQLLDLVHDLELEPVTARLRHYAEQARRLAEKLEKQVNVSVVGDGFRTDPQRWAHFWSALIHAVRNAVDHGIEPAVERVRAGKLPAGNLYLRAEQQGSELVIAVEEDGRGISWKAVRERAESLGVIPTTEQDLHEALFLDGLSTAQEITETSGRGVGMGALRAAVIELGGRLEIESREGVGTKIRMRFPRTSARPRASLAPVVASVN